MGLAGAAWPQSDNVLTALDVLGPGQFQDLFLVEGWNNREVEAIQAFDRRELRRFDAALDHPPLTFNQL